MLVWRLGVHGQGFGVGEGLDGDVEFGVGGEIAAAVSEVGALEEGGVREGFFEAFQAVAIDWLVSGAIVMHHLYCGKATHTFTATGMRSSEELAKVKGSIMRATSLQYWR